jgi:predicted DNA-binding transcriptional regulator YafY
MRRADRLFTLLLYLRRRRAVTAAELARRLEVSERTVYRDVRDLSLSGVPVEGEAGVGYRLRPGFEVPPLMFTTDELEALRLGAKMVQGWADETLAQAAERALDKIEVVLPDRLKTVEPAKLFVPDFFVPENFKQALAELRRAVEGRRRVWMKYEDRGAQTTERTVRPLGLFYWGAAWSLAGWCELREGFRNFRLDRMRDLRVLDDVFEPDPAKGLEAFLAAIRT